MGQHEAVSTGHHSELSITPMNADDFDDLFAIYREVVEDDGARPVGASPSPTVFAQGWLDKREVFVARESGQIVGSFFVRCNFPAFAAHIAQSGYMIARHARRRGIGTLLVTESITQARRLGYQALMFNLVFESNPSRSIYEQAGFAVIGRVPRARDNEDGLVYYKDLTL